MRFGTPSSFNNAVDVVGLEGIAYFFKLAYLLLELGSNTLLAFYKCEEPVLNLDSLN